jgi:hypothetical protein
MAKYWQIEDGKLLECWRHRIIGCVHYSGSEQKSRWYEFPVGMSVELRKTLNISQLNYYG